MKIIVVILFILVVVGCEIIVTKHDAFEEMIKALQEYKITKKRPDYLEEAAKTYNTPNFFLNPNAKFNRDEVCTTCFLVSELFIHQRKNGMNDSNFAKEGLFFCNLYSGYTERVCEGMVELNTPALLYIIDNTPNLNGTDVCALAFQYQGCALPERFDWKVEIPPGNTVPKPQSTGLKTFNILHITDIHYDPRYTTNKTNDCGEPVCCQDDQADGTTSQNSCGYWSDYINADIPWRTVVDALEQSNKSHDFEYVYFTGDIIPHRVWNTSILDNTQIIAQVLDAFVQTYKVPVFPCLGNHEAHPSNLFSEVTDPTLSTSWLFDILFQKLSRWMPIDEVKDTVLKGGYYTVSPRKGLRLVVLNNNICNNDNWWLIYNPVDPYSQLKWLSEVLLKAEQNGERVHLLHHIPTGRNECFTIWAREFRKIVDRFAHTIAAQFNGHTHRDEFYIYYNRSNPSQAVSTAWNGASIVTYDKANPSYKVLTVDEESFDQLDFEEWAYNLTLANINGDKDPEWYKLYSFKDAYGVKSLEAEEIDQLVLKMTKKHELIDQYYRFKFRNGDVALKEGCDDDCKKDLLCTMVKTEFADNSVCDKVKNLYDNNNGTIQDNLV